MGQAFPCRIELSFGFGSRFHIFPQRYTSAQTIESFSCPHPAPQRMHKRYSVNSWLAVKHCFWCHRRETYWQASTFWGSQCIFRTSTRHHRILGKAETLRVVISDPFRPMPTICYNERGRFGGLFYIYGSRSTFVLSSGLLLSPQQLANMLAPNPVAATKIFHRRLQSLLNNLLFGETRPFGTVIDFLGRVEQQSRHSPHLNLLIWTENKSLKLTGDSHLDGKKVSEFVELFCTALPPPTTWLLRRTYSLHINQFLFLSIISFIQASRVLHYRYLFLSDMPPYQHRTIFVHLKGASKATQNFESKLLQHSCTRASPIVLQMANPVDSSSLFLISPAFL